MDNISNPLLPSILPEEVLQLTVAGKQPKVRDFWKFLKHSPIYQLMTDLQTIFDTVEHKDSMHIVLQLTEAKDKLASQSRRISNVQISDRKGQHISFTLLDTCVIEMLDGRVYIHGTNFDIFADPAREVVAIEEIDDGIV